MGGADDKKIDQIVDRLKSGLQRQKKAYEKMLELSERQNKILESENITELTELVQAKNSVMNEIEDAEDQVVPVLQRWKKIKSEFPEEEVEVIEKMFREVRDLLAEIIEVESELEEVAESMKDVTSSEIEKLMRAQDAREEYGNKNAHGSRSEKEESE